MGQPAYSAVSNIGNTLVNRPFGGGNLFARVGRKALPPWAADFDCSTWGQFFLKFVVSHPAVTCAIPATSVGVIWSSTLASLLALPLLTRTARQRPASSAVGG